MVRTRNGSQAASGPGRIGTSWPLYENGRHFKLGYLLNAAAVDAVVPVQIGAISAHHAGCFECDLATNILSWSGGVFDLFGLPRDAKITRDEIVGLYCEGSRAAMERLRAEAIRDCKGFTLDAQIRSAQSETRWIRLIAAPVLEGGQVTRLRGLKFPIE